jgi:hypothetical protein
MNIIAHTFLKLISILRTAPESHQTDNLCRELVAWLSKLPKHYALVAFIHHGNFETYRWYNGTPKLLSLHGIYLHKREHSRGEGWFIFAELVPNRVTTHRLSIDDLEEDSRAA